MIRYLSEDKVKDAIVNALEHREDVPDDAIDEVLKDIGEIPTEDVVPVARGKKRKTIQIEIPEKTLFAFINCVYWENGKEHLSVDSIDSKDIAQRLVLKEQTDADATD